MAELAALDAQRRLPVANPSLSVGRPHSIGWERVGPPCSARDLATTWLFAAWKLPFTRVQVDVSGNVAGAAELLTHTVLER